VLNPAITPDHTFCFEKVLPPHDKGIVLGAAEKAEGYLADANRQLEANPNSVHAKFLRAASLQMSGQIEAADDAVTELLSERARRIAQISDRPDHAA
jgi:hypothetical protein